MKKFFAVSILGVLLNASSSLAAQGANSNAWPDPYSMPPETGVVNVKDYGAKGDGVTDDTAALRRCIDANKRWFKVIYFPIGTYLVSDTLTYGPDKGLAKFTTVQGESRTKSILKLRDNAPGFDNPSERKYLFSTFTGGTTGDAFNNNIYNITFEVGAGNPGAVGVQYTSNNSGTMDNVIIRSSDAEKRGFAGLDLRRAEPGPALLRDVTIEGFDLGIDSQFIVFGMFGERVTLRNQRVAGIRNGDQVLVFRHLLSENKVPAIEQINDSACLFLYDSELRGGDANAPAILNRRGKIGMRDVAQSGYGIFVRNLDTPAADLNGTQIGEYYSHGPAQSYSALSSPYQTLRLPVEETPKPPLEPVANWVIVDREELKKAEDDTPLIQAALDKAAAENKATVCIPGGLGEGEIRVNDTLKISGSVRRLIGMDAVWRFGGKLIASENPIFEVDNISGADVTIERIVLIEWDNHRFRLVKQNTTKPLVLKDLVFGRMGDASANHSYYVGTPNAKLFIENATTGVLQLEPGQKVWLRQYNPEVNLPMIVNNGADVWVMGLKTESSGATVALTKNKGRTEILGMINYPSWGPEQIKDANDRVMFITESGGQLAASLGEYAWRGDYGYDKILRETRGEKTAELTKLQVNSGGRGAGGTYPLLTGYAGTATSAPAAISDLKAAPKAGALANEIIWQHKGDADLFRVERAPAQGEFAAIGTVPAMQRAFIDRNVKDGEIYRYRVVPLNTFGSKTEGALVAQTTARGGAHGSGTGLLARYYGATDWSGGAKITKVEGPIDFSWEGGAPQGLPNDNWTAAWIGFIEPRYSEYYTFETWSDDGARLWIDGKSVIDEWRNFAAAQSGEIYLEAGKKYPIRLEYLELTGGAGMKLSWQSASQNKEIVAMSQLYPANETAPILPLISVEAKGDAVEGGASATLIFKRDGDTAAPLPVALAARGSARRSLDYSLPATVEFKAGEKQVSLAVPALTDGLIEGTEEAEVYLLSSPDYRIGGASAKWKIADKDTPPGKGLGTGLNAEYYNVTVKDDYPWPNEPTRRWWALSDLKKVHERVDPNLDRRFDGGPPAPGVAENPFYVRWSALLEPRFSEEYTFYLFGDDGLRLRFDGKYYEKINDSWPMFAGDHVFKVPLEAWKKVPLILEFTGTGGGNGVRLEWESASQPREAVPMSQFYPAPFPDGPINPKKGPMNAPLK